MSVVDSSDVGELVYVTIFFSGVESSIKKIKFR